jgi:hypothetical protein
MKGAVVYTDWRRLKIVGSATGFMIVGSATGVIARFMDGVISQARMKEEDAVVRADDSIALAPQSSAGESETLLHVVPCGLIVSAAAAVPATASKLAKPTTKLTAKAVVATCTSST